MWSFHISTLYKSTLAYSEEPASSSLVMDITDRTKLSLTVYNGQDFPAWREETKLNLMALNLWRLVLGTESEPEDRSQKERFQARMDQAYALICKSLSPTYRECLKDMETEDPVEAWRRVEKCCNIVAANTESALLKKLLRLKCIDESRVREYLSVFSETVRRLITYGMVIPEKLLIAMLLEGLPESYENFSQMINMNKDLPNLDTVKELISGEAQSRKLRLISESESAQLARLKGFNRNSRKCPHCQRGRHKEADCWVKYPEKAPKVRKCKQAEHKAAYNHDSETESEKLNFAVINYNGDYAF